MIFAHALQGRGTERALVRLLTEFDRRVLAPELALVSVRGEFLSALPDDVRIHDLGGRKRTSAALPRLERLIRRIDPDCALGVHISAGRVLSMLRLLHPRLPVICMEADPFTRIEGEKGNLRLRTAASNIAYRLATHIVAASDVVADDLVDRFGISRKKISLIPLPSVDQDVLSAAKEALDEPPYDQPNRDVIVTIGNMFAHKDQRTLIDAFRIVNQEHPSHLVLIGEGTVRPALQDFARELGIADRVWFVGFQQNPFKYLARSRVFASSSLAEGFDISQIEAMACGVPVVVTDAPRFRAVEDEVSGLLTPPGNPDALASAILRILRDPELAAQLANNAREAAKAFSADKIARRYEDLITRIAGKA